MNSAVADIRIDPDNTEFLNKINVYMMVILFLMVSCFFSWSENIIITRGIKVVGRLGVLIASYLVYKKILNQGAVDSLIWDNSLAFIFYALYLVLGFASFAWSTKPSYSILQWFMTSQTLIFCYFFIRSLFLLDEYFPDHGVRLYNLIGTVSFILMTIFLIGMFADPDSFIRKTHGGEEERLGGFLMNPNELGMLAGLGVAGLLFDLKRDYRKIWTFIKLGIIFWALYATGSRSSLIAALMIIGFHVKQSDNVKLKIIIMTGMMLVGPLAIYKVVLKDGDSSRMEEVMSMTGRLPFWTALISEGLPREPLFGFGFMRIAYRDFFQGAHTYPGKMTHNTFMQVLMNLGFVGMTIVIFQMMFTFRGISRQPNPEKRLMLFSSLIPLIINSITEFGIFGESNYGILFYQLIFMYISFKQRFHLTPIDRLFFTQKKTAILS